MKDGQTIKMKSGAAIILGLLAVAVAIFGCALSTRYQIAATAPGGVVRLDQKNGQVCFYNFEESSFTNCTPEDDQPADKP
jgi:hypothetical protein